MTYVPFKYFNSGIAITNPRFRHRWSWPLSYFLDQLASWISIASLYIDGFVDSSRWNYTNNRLSVRSVNKSNQKSYLLVVVACILYVFSRCINSLESIEEKAWCSHGFVHVLDYLLDLYMVTRLNTLSWNLTIYIAEQWDLVLCG